MIEPQPAAGQPRRAHPLHRFAHDAMACTFELYLLAEDAKYACQAADTAFKEVDRLEAELSRFVPTSDVARVNALRVGQPTSVGIEVLECLQLAAKLYDETGGAFDVAAGSHGQAAPPHATAPLEIGFAGRQVGVCVEGVQVDLGGIGKGYAVDQIVAILRDWSITAGLIQAGQSAVFALGRPAPGERWSIAIRDPQSPADVLRHVALAGEALSGSGRLLHGDHIIDPRRGQPVTDKLGAWALAPSATLADALSTAFFVMSPSEIEAYCRRHADVAGLICLAEAEGAALRHFGRSPAG